MNKKELEKLVELRGMLLSRFERLKDYRNNKNAIMREIEHAELLHETIRQIDDVLRDHVKFS
jgi:hypothetical protein